ncbi:NUDIX hydrolase [Bradyrhizobium septentrionale]|uniref:NUDIX hydrolase n=1 Tax=Bradyrhizobium septentrionale TaxID=1404411 RepID=A0ABZ2P5B8_9BRAD
MARTPVLAAGGIVLRETPPRFAVVRLRKRNEWVLPKGKLDDGETPRDAAEREVLEETGHDVDVHEFLGTLVYDSGGRSKVVHYWRMEAGGKPVRALMSDIREVDWLPLDAALERLSRGYERAFLENVGPIALQAAEDAERARRALARAAAAERRRSRAAMGRRSSMSRTPSTRLTSLTRPCSRRRRPSNRRRWRRAKAIRRRWRRTAALRRLATWSRRSMSRRRPHPKRRRHPCATSRRVR